MALDISTLGLETPPRSFDYDWQTTVQYALGIGATQGELEYLYEGHGPKVFPTFAVIPTFPVVKELFDKTGGDPKLLVHGGQSITLHRAIPPQARLQTTAKIVGVYDLKRFAQVIIRTTTTLEGNPCFDTEWSMIFRDQGGFGGPRPSKQTSPKIPKEATPSWITRQRTAPEQALLYRLSGDLNPLHADPEFAEKVGFARGPILHGLCTFGFVARAVLSQLPKGEHQQLASLCVQFRQPVWPGQSLQTEGYQLDANTLGLKVFAGDSDEELAANQVITQAWATIRKA